MTNAGWYPDPAGAPDTYRYWDGQSWSQMTTSHPPAAAQPTPQPPQQPQQPTPPAAAPTQFPPQQPQQPNQGGYGAVPQPQQPQPTPGYGAGGFSGGPGGPGPGGYPQQQWSPTPSGSSGGGSGKTIGIVIAAVLTLVLLGVGGFFGVRALTGDDDGDKSANDPTRSESSDATESSDPTDGSDPTESSTDASSSSTIAPTGIQCTGGTPKPATDPGKNPPALTGGGLTIPRLGGFTVDIGFSDALPFADGIIVQYANVTDNWVTEYAVGGLSKANGFTSTDQAAEIIMQCLTMNDLVYKGFDSRKDQKREAVTLDGMSGYSITSEIRVKDSEVTVEGDVTTVIVLDTGDADSYGVFIGVAPIGDTAKIAQAERVAKSIKAD